MSSPSFGIWAKGLSGKGQEWRKIALKRPVSLWRALV